MTAPKLLTVTEAARMAGVATSSFRTYLVRGTAPTPDQYAGVTPLFKVSTIQRWIANRPARGRPRKQVA